MTALPEWRPDCGGDWTLSGEGFFANYWPDNTVSASIWHGDERCSTSGVVARGSRAECQAFAERWIRENLHNTHLVTALTIVDFLRARLDEDEAVAREAFDAAEREPVSFRPMDGAQTAGALSVMEMWVRWTPTRVLADVEAKRRIVANMQTLSSQAWQDGDAAPVMEVCSTRVLRHLASVYADHPDYDEAWRP